MYNSIVASYGNTVYQSSELDVGTNYDYTYDGYLYGYITTASIMKFNVQTAITGKTILEAKLRLYEYMFPGDPIGQYRLGAIATSWDPATITYNNSTNMQYYLNSQIDFSAIYSTVVPLEFNVTATVQNWANGTYTNYGFKIWDSNPQLPGQTSYQATSIESLEIRSDDTRRPQLYIRYH
jgi:hypothetical protein